RPPPESSLFPYTSLFRSKMWGVVRAEPGARGSRSVDAGEHLGQQVHRQAHDVGFSPADQVEPTGAVLVAERSGFSFPEATGEVRSEEHTSELQSRENLVC